MKVQQNPHDKKTTCRTGIVSRFLFSSAFLGLVIGLFEAELLWTTPRVIPLLVPDVGWVIWFLAPLVDMLFFALVGFGLGFVADRTTQTELFVAVEGGIAITFVYLTVKWLHLQIGMHPFNPAMELQIPLIVFTAGFAASLILITLVWPRLAVFGGHWLDRLLLPLARGLAASAVVAIMGIGVFVVRPSFSGTPVQAAPPPTGAPNIIFITLDTVRADHLSSYGYSRPTTPNIDRFARTGVLFENAVSPSSWTLASHASMFTGLLPQQHGADWAVSLEQSPWTLAEILRSRGYVTAGFIGNGFYLERGWGTAQGFEIYDDLGFSLTHNLAQTMIGNAAVQPLYQVLGHYNFFDRRNAQEVNASVFRWYGRRPRNPYFIFINYLDAHDPYVTSEPYEHRFGRLPETLARKLHVATQNAANSSSFSPGESALLADGYDNCLAYLDNQVGELIEFLRRMPGWQNTIVIITSDHGDEFGGHMSYDHGRNLYRGVLHVPLIIAGPGIPRGLRINHLVGTRQLFSTVLDQVGRGNTPFSRASLARFWNVSYKPGAFDNNVVSELIPEWSRDGGPIASLTTSQWQYIEHRDGRQELYDWIIDPREQNNLAASPGRQATLEELHSRLVSLVSDATGPWRGSEYLGALDSTEGSGRLSLLRPLPLQPETPNSRYRIGMAQEFFKPAESMPIRPTQSERDLMRSLPYQ